MLDDTFDKYLDKYNPALVRLLARRRITSKSAVAISDEEVAANAGLPISIVHRIKTAPNWDDVTIGHFRAFCRGCNFNPMSAEDRNRDNAYFRSSNGAFKYLRKSPLWKTQFLPLINLLQSRIGQKR